MAFPKYFVQQLHSDDLKQFMTKYANPPLLLALVLVAQEALNAKTSLEFTHFYGRHLVGEWAEDDEQVDTLRAKVAKDMRSPKGPSRPSKRQKAHESADFEGVNAL